MSAQPVKKILMVAAADSDLNKTMINLIGLATTGFDYIILN
jgi:hypothetical protein